MSGLTALVLDGNGCSKTHTIVSPYVEYLFRVAQEISDMTGTYMALSSGYEHICGILQDGRVECSESAEGVFGPGRANPPVGRFISISAAKDNTCGVRGDGKLDCWGWYPFLQNIPEFGNFVQVVSTGSIACALSLDGSVECWGASTPPRRSRLSQSAWPSV